MSNEVLAAIGDMVVVHKQFEGWARAGWDSISNNACEDTRLPFGDWCVRREVSWHDTGEQSSIAIRRWLYLTYAYASVICKLALYPSTVLKNARFVVRNRDVIFSCVCLSNLWLSQFVANVTIREHATCFFLILQHVSLVRKDNKSITANNNQQ